MNTLKNLFVFSLLIISSLCRAAQVGEVIVEDAKVYQYPQASSRVVSTLHRGVTVPVSNLPTEGFYKTRLPSGDTAWLSGNDILAGGGKSSESNPPLPPVKRKPPQGRVKPVEANVGDVEGAEDSDPVSSSPSDRMRILIGYGFQNLSFNGLAANFEKVDSLNPGTNLGVEFQFRMHSWLHWAAKAERLSGSTPEQIVSNGAKQTITYSNIPVELGLVITPFPASRFRISLGAYAGASISSSVNIHQVGASTTGDVTYSSVDPCALGSVQMAYGIGHHFLIFAEGGYRYQVTAALPATTTFGAVPSFKLNYSGILGRLGIGFQF